MRRHRRLVALVVASAAIAASMGSARAIEDHSFRIALSAVAKATCADVAPASLARLALGAVLVQQPDLEGYEPAERRLVLSRAATLRLVTNADALERERDLEATGPLPDASGRAFVVTIGGERQVGGMVVARLEDLRGHGECPLLVRGPVLGGRLHVLIGRPRAHDELREPFWKVFMEGGPRAALAPALPPKADALLSSLFPLK
jgi:hypothetical protein